MIVQRFPLTLHDDDRGWFTELDPRERAAEADPPGEPLPLEPGVIRGLHYHERGQDDLFVCLSGMVRVVVLDRGTGEVFARTSATTTRWRSTCRESMRTATRR